MTKVRVQFYQENVNDFLDTLAVFPDIPHNSDFYGDSLVTCYAHYGQHGAADIDYVNELELAKPEQYNELLNELKDVYSNCKLVIMN